MSFGEVIYHLLEGAKSGFKSALILVLSVIALLVILASIL